MNNFHQIIHNLAVQTIEFMAGRGLRLLCAESCTGGQLAGSITTIAGASRILWGSLVVYDNQAKMDLLAVPPDILQQFGAVSPQTCRSMLHGLDRIGQKHPEHQFVNVAITGVAGPGASALKPAGLVYIGLGYAGKDQIYEHYFSGERNAVQAQAVIQAMEYITKVH